MDDQQAYGGSHFSRGFTSSKPSTNYPFEDSLKKAKDGKTLENHVKIQFKQKFAGALKSGKMVFAK